MDLNNIINRLQNAMLDTAERVAEPEGIDVLALIEMKTAIDLMSAAARRLEAADLHQTRAIASSPIAAAKAWYSRGS